MSQHQDSPELFDEATVRKSMNLSRRSNTTKKPVNSSDTTKNNATDFEKSDELRVYRQNTFRFRIAHTKYIFLMFFLGLLQLFAVIFFCKGFLLTRNVIGDVATFDVQLQGLSEKNFANEKNQIVFNKTVILIIDALRFDFVSPQPHSNEVYHNHFPILQNAPHSYLYKFLSDPPTTTLQRLKGLTTGSLPTFIDAGSNFNGEVIDEDNLIKQFHLNNKTTYFAGDDTWKALFDPYLSKKSKYYESLNVWDLETVDQGVMRYFDEHLTEKDEEWDVLIGHMLGVDHVGHKHGPNHHEMSTKLEQMNAFVSEQLLPKIDNDTILFIFGDHGMDHTGNHGGDSKDELETTLFVYSPKFGVTPPKSTNHDHKVVNQIDFVPTLSLLLNIPIPFNNLGWPIEDIIENSGFAQTLNQIHHYQETSKVLEGNPLLLTNLNTHFNKNEGAIYQRLFLENCKSMWAKFDLISISIGITLLSISLCLIIVITKLIPSIVVGQMVHEFVPSIIVMCMISCVSLNSIFQILNQPSFLENWKFCTLFSLAIGIIVGCCIPIFDRYTIKWMAIKFFEEINDYWSRVAVLMITLHALCFTSNSFTIWEDKIVAFLLTTIGFLTLYEFAFAPKRASTNALFTAASSRVSNMLSKTQHSTFVSSWTHRSHSPDKQHSSDLHTANEGENVSDNTASSETLPLGRFARVIGAYHSLLLILATRLASNITICREEQGTKCIPTFVNANNYSWWAMLGIFLLIWSLPTCIKGYYNISSSYQAAAPVWINQFLKSSLFLSFIYWFLNYYETTYGSLPFDAQIWKFSISRIVAGFSLVALNIGWAMGPMCIKLDLRNTDLKSQTATILGYSNVYGAQFFLLVINFVMAIMFFSKPLAQLSLFLMINQLLSILEIFDLLKLKENLIGPVTLGLLAYQHFFSTGHQATIPSIQWDTGFMLTEKITFPFTHISLILNTFGPFFIVALSVALLTLWKQPPSVLKPQTLLSRIVSNCGMLLIYNTVLCLSSFAWVTHFRRHLMVWKIFCPRFMFSCMTLLVIQVVVIFVTVAFASGRLIRQINNIFWK